MPVADEIRSDTPGMEPPTGPRVDLPPPSASRRRRRWIWAAGLAALALVATAVVLLVTGTFSSDKKSKNSSTVTGPTDAPFKLDYPHSWRPLGQTQLAQLPGRPLAVLRRTDGHGTFVVARRGPVTTPLADLAKGLKGRLSKQFSDFREIGAKTVTLHGSRSLVYTFARTKTGTAQSLVVVPAGDHSFTLNAVVPPQSPDAAREVGAMIASFDPTGDS
jgi:hypothetical protein